MRGACLSDLITFIHSFRSQGTRRELKIQDKTNICLSETTVLTHRALPPTNLSSRGSPSRKRVPAVYAIVSFFYLSSDIVENATNMRLAGWEREKERRKERGQRERETSRRYEKPPPLGIELWLPARSKSDSAPSLSEYNCIYLDSPDWIIGERGERETLSSDPPSIERELKHFAMSWVYSTFRRFGPFCYLSLSSYPLRNAFFSIVSSRLRSSFSTALFYVPLIDGIWRIFCVLELRSHILVFGYFPSCISLSLLSTPSLPTFLSYHGKKKITFVSALVNLSAEITEFIFQKANDNTGLKSPWVM